MRHEGAISLEVRVLSEQLLIRFGSYPGGAFGRLEVSKSRGQSSTQGGDATVQAATRVNAEQASKVKIGAPIRLRYGEGRCASGKRSTRAPLAVLRGSGNGMYGELIGQRGRPVAGEGLRPSTEPRVSAGAGVGEAHSTEEAGE